MSKRAGGERRNNRRRESGAVLEGRLRFQGELPCLKMMWTFASQKGSLHFKSN